MNGRLNRRADEWGLSLPQKVAHTRAAWARLKHGSVAPMRTEGQTESQALHEPPRRAATRTDDAMDESSKRAAH